MLDYLKRIQRNADYCGALGAPGPSAESLLRSGNQSERPEPEPTSEPEPTPAPTPAPVQASPQKKGHFVSFSANPSHSKTLSLCASSSPPHEKAPQALLEKPNSDSKRPREAPRSLQSQSYVCEKIGENRYVYRLSSRLKSQVSKGFSRQSQSQSQSLTEGLVPREAESESKTAVVNLSRQLQNASELGEPPSNSRSREFTEPGPPLESRATTEVSLLGRSAALEPNPREARTAGPGKEAELLRLREENTRLGLENRELASVNQVGLD